MVIPRVGQSNPNSSSTTSNKLWNSGCFKVLLLKSSTSILPDIIKEMGVQLMGITHVKQKLQRTLSARIRAMSAASNVPKGHFAVYVGESKKRFVIPLWYLKQPLFHSLLDVVEEEFGFDCPTRGITIPCSEDYFTSVTSALSC